MLKTTDTYTYINLPVSPSTFDEIYHLLKEAGYTHAIEGTGGAIDMHGIALIKGKVCTECDGDGYVSVESYVSGDQNMIEEFRCPECNGAGILS